MSEIDGKYQQLGGPSGFLGAATSDEQTCADGAGKFRIYAGGRIYSSPASGTHEVHGQILVKWLTLGAEQSSLGYPTSDEQGVGDANDTERRFNDFEHGAIYWSGETGTHEVHGAILTKWRTMIATLGLPVTDERIVSDGVGRYSDFQNGAIYWTRKLGAHAIYGAIRGKWMALGGARGPLGYPTTDETGTPNPADTGARFNLFEHGSIYWRGGFPAYAVQGAIDEQWASQGREKGAFGFPLSDELPSVRGSSRFNNFEHGTLTRPNPHSIPRTIGNGATPEFAFAFDLKFDGSPNVASAHKMHASQGFRLVSLSIWGSPTDPRYAAVWVKESGAAQKVFFKAKDGEFQKLLKQLIDAEFLPTIIAATGTASDAVFALVAEERSGPVPVIRHRLLAGPDEGLNHRETFAYWNQWARGNNHILRWASIYGDADDPRYAAIWELDKHGVTWNTAYHDAAFQIPHNVQPEADPAIYDNKDDLAAIVQAQSFWARPSFRAQGAGGRQLFVFRDDRVGATELRENLTGAQVQSEAENLKAVPLCVQGTRVNGESRFAAIFAPHVRPMARKLTIKGDAVKSLVALDDTVGGMLRRSNARNASLAVMRDGRLVYARAFTWAEADAAPATPKHTFRIASISKSLTAVAAYQTLKLEEREDPLVNHLTGLPATLDAKFKDIRIRHLVTHRSGLQRNIADAADRVDEVLKFFGNGKSVPLTMKDVGTYMASLPLDFVPDSEERYSNLGFFFLSWLVEQKRGNYVDAVRQHIFAPCGIPVNRPKVTGLPTIASEAVAFDRELRVGRSVLDAKRPITPIEYGTLNFNISAGAGGWSFAPADYVRFLTRLFDDSGTLLAPEYLAGLTPREIDEMREHGGGLVGAETYARHFEHQGQRMAYAIFYNRDVPGDFDLHVRDVITALPESAWPDHDLFPTLDIQ